MCHWSEKISAIFIYINIIKSIHQNLKKQIQVDSYESDANSFQYLLKFFIFLFSQLYFEQ